MLVTYSIKFVAVLVTCHTGSCKCQAVRVMRFDDQNTAHTDSNTKE